MINEAFIKKDSETGLEYIEGKDKIIFSNGVLVSKEEYKNNRGNIGNLIRENNLNHRNSGYDYAYAKTTGVIRKKAIHTVGVSGTTPAVKEPSEKAVNVEKLQKKTVGKVKSNFNMFDWAYPKLMLLLAVFCSILSIYFTGVYMQRLQSGFIAYCISTCMLLYGLVGTQMARRAWHNKRFVQALIYGVTSFCTIGFSMYTSLDVNYAKYVENHKEVVVSVEVKENNNIEYELLQEEMTANKEQIEKLSKTYVVMWDGERQTNVVVEGKVTEKAQEQINELTVRNREINQRLIELAHEGTKLEQSETDQAKTMTDLLGAIFGISGNIMQMIILLLPSIFIDLVNVLSITIYNDRFTKEEKNESTDRRQ